MGFFKSLFSSNNSETDEQTLEQEAAEKKRITFETLCDNGLRAMNIKEFRLATDYLSKAIELEPDKRAGCGTDGWCSGLRHRP